MFSRVVSAVISGVEARAYPGGSGCKPRASQFFCDRRCKYAGERGAGQSENGAEEQRDGASAPESYGEPGSGRYQERGNGF